MQALVADHDECNVPFGADISNESSVDIFDVFGTDYRAFEVGNWLTCSL